MYFFYMFIIPVNFQLLSLHGITLIWNLNSCLSFFEKEEAEKLSESLQCIEDPNRIKYCY